MADPYRGPAENPHVTRAITALRQARSFLEALAENLKAQAFNETAELLTLTVRHTEDHERNAVIDQFHAALWSSLNEARDLLERAGYEIDPAARARWADKQDTGTPTRCLERLQALLPGVDFSSPLDEEAAAYLADQRRSRRLWWPIGLGLGLGIPAALIVALLVCN